ncbi:hypothetical protein JMN32_00120 [Fulvivirga sp. 29W222]|uniref:Uncharacterized protein n=1 Tax=Fulvivirga marina TaxID=2494733 RepID=A0A937KAL5_9BACT|nr:hypothetical protein [Fulvivirga marina]MBL6444692.1 hypothetical protein [Fulvivirga marina]
MNYIELAGIIIVIITGCIKIVEGIIKSQVEKRIKLEKEKIAGSHSGDNLVSNWVQWSQTLEKRVKEAEETIGALQEVIQYQKLKLIEMEGHNKALQDELQILKHKAK